jgi:hypothetical protein
VANLSFTCGFCGDKVASDRGFKIGAHGDGSGGQIGGIYICPNCKGPNFKTHKVNGTRGNLLEEQLKMSLMN